MENIKSKLNLDLKGVWTIGKIRNGIKYDITEYENIIPLIYQSAIVERMTSATPTYSLLANYIAVGTGTNTPSTSDIKLQTETARTLATTRANDDNVGAVATIFEAGSISGSTITIKEAGIFSEGTATTDSGLIVSRVAIDKTLTSLDTLFLDWRITIANA